MASNQIKRIPLTSRGVNSGIDNTWCNAFLDNGLACPVALNKADRGHTTTDSQGYWWCNEHKNRGWLLDYAKEHEFPMIHFSDEDGQRYAIGNNKKDPEMWKMVVPVTREKVVVAAIAAMRAKYEANDDEF